MPKTLVISLDVVYTQMWPIILKVFTVLLNTCGCAEMVLRPRGLEVSIGVNMPKWGDMGSLPPQGWV